MSGDYAIVLTAAERCDYSTSCDAQARVRVYLKSGLHIQFCKHHADEQPDSLYSDAEYVINECRYILGY